jgi:hypothetical protein
MVRHRLAGHQPQRSPTPSAYRAGHEGKQMGQSASPATSADPLQSGIRFLPHLLSAPPSVHLAMHFPLAGSDVDLPCSVGMTR